MMALKRGPRTEGSAKELQAEMAEAVGPRDSGGWSRNTFEKKKVRSRIVWETERRTGKGR